MPCANIRFLTSLSCHTHIHKGQVQNIIGQRAYEKLIHKLKINRTKLEIQLLFLDVSSKHGKK